MNSSHLFDRIVFVLCILRKVVNGAFSLTVRLQQDINDFDLVLCDVDVADKIF